jgi:N-hydroxyarylamine O-acetyltransferase
MFLTVEIEGELFAVDPGFGGRCANVPVPVREGDDVLDGVYRHRFVRIDGEWMLETEIDGKMTPLWTSTLEPQLPIDFELANHWIATAAASPFVNKLVLRAVTPDGRTSVVNRHVSVSRGDVARTYELPDRRALRTLLRDDFGFDLPDVERMRVPHVPEWT